MSVSPDKTTRSLLGGTAKGGDGSLIPIPRTIAGASIVIALEAVFNVVRALSFGGNTSKLVQTLIDNNAKAKKPKSPYGLAQATHDLDQFKHNGITQALIMGAALIVLALLIRGGRMAHNARWLVILILVFTGAPLSFNVSGDLNAGYNVLGVLVALSAIAVIALIFVKPSREFFSRTRAATGRPGLLGPRPGAAGRGAGARTSAPRPGGLFGGLFGPPRTGASSSRGASTSSTAGEPNPAAGRTNAKVRTTTTDAAIAKGAELARERAKASKAKSRRAPDQAR
ncbi:MAG TPA: hypothetical protein VGL26_03215 [Jatrophihabitans sp.]